ncbi:glycosyltransferase family 2 protein [Azospirillum sp. YIM DDC1]|uniref:Glycosyltransferase family 2 protein n=1 Tax=Azospirillum aestuarii TaxID=2802052 RepID=A0ABS1HWU7_9PROT|nr:glycosyltransferase family 2 protein [Azospirillum aestuarii]MBK4719302.1 glycosyltransferase family 2 protein [Azospirillum aestuarii]
MPTVSAVIATFNRAPELRTALSRLLAQTHPVAEILVVDDGSTDGTDAMVRGEFPTVRYVRLPHNAGLIYARNFGFVNTAGDYVLSVDDDSWFAEPDGLARAVAYMETHADVAALACNIETRDGLVYFPPQAAPFDAPWYVGCGHLLRRSAVAAAGLYMPELYRQGEEKDRCLRLIGAGHRVVALPGVMVYHDKSEKGRKPGLERFYNHRNDLIREIARCPARLLPWRFARSWIGNSWKNLRHGPRLTDLKVLLALPEILRIGLKHRAPVSEDAYRRWLHLSKTAAPGLPQPDPAPAHNPLSRPAREG